ncbi:MAG: hypothetical protein FWE18_00155 [Alphaproteobacteria bacterium]|nr:hypothetical protein [Alphaproteobacteria bacterium]
MGAFSIFRLIISNLAVIKLFFKSKTGILTIVISILAFFATKYFGFEEETSLQVFNTLLGMEITTNGILFSKTAITAICVILGMIALIIGIIAYYFLYESFENRRIRTLTKELEILTLNYNILSMKKQIEKLEEDKNKEEEIDRKRKN